jgi:hypothetical protein
MNEVKNPAWTWICHCTTGVIVTSGYFKETGAVGRLLDQEVRNPDTDATTRHSTYGIFSLSISALASATVALMLFWPLLTFVGNKGRCSFLLRNISNTLFGRRLTRERSFFCLATPFSRMRPVGANNTSEFTKFGK